MRGVSERVARKAVERWELEHGHVRVDACGCRYWVRPDPGSTLPLPSRPRVSRRVFLCAMHGRR